LAGERPASNRTILAKKINKTGLLWKKQTTNQCTNKRTYTRY